MKKIYVHGLGQTLNSWNKTIEYLGGAENCMCPDLTKLDCGEIVTYRTLYEKFADECDQCEDSVALCGLSLGGVLALNYAIEHPEKVCMLILIAAQYKMPKLLLTLQNLLFRIMPQSTFLETGFSKENMISLCKTMSELDFSKSLGGITCPTLIICGEKDSANRKASQKLAASIKGSKLVIVDKAGHEVNAEAPEKLAEILRDFFNTCRI